MMIFLAFALIAAAVLGLLTYFYWLPMYREWQDKHILTAKSGEYGFTVYYKCSCGWKGDESYSFTTAEREAQAHRAEGLEWEKTEDELEAVKEKKVYEID